MNISNQVFVIFRKIILENQKYLKFKEPLFEILSLIINAIIVRFADEKRVTSRGRKIKMSTFLRKDISLEDDLKPHINLFCEIYGMAFDHLMIPEFTIHSGAKLVKVYSDVFQSCMTDNPGLMIFQNNPQTVSVLTCKMNGIEARGLVWRCESGVVVLDRIYPNDSCAIPAMQKHAHSQGWWVRKYNNAGGNSNSSEAATYIKPDKTTVEISESVRLTIPTRLSFYGDTFCFGEHLGDEEWRIWSVKKNDSKFYMPFTNAYGIQVNKYVDCSECMTEILDPIENNSHICVKCSHAFLKFSYYNPLRYEPATQEFTESD